MTRSDAPPLHAQRQLGPRAGFTFSPIFRYRSKTPYNVILGVDTNRDGTTTNDLPPGVTHVQLRPRRRLQAVRPAGVEAVRPGQPRPAGADRGDLQPVQLQEPGVLRDQHGRRATSASRRSTPGDFRAASSAWSSSASASSSRLLGVAAYAATHQRGGEATPRPFFRLIIRRARAVFSWARKGACERRFRARRGCASVRRSLACGGGGVFGTPLYVYSRAAVLEAYRGYDRAFASVPHRIHYAMKANASLGLLQVLRGLGRGSTWSRASSSWRRGGPVSPRQDIVFAGRRQDRGRDRPRPGARHRPLQRGERRGGRADRARRGAAGARSPRLACA